MTVKRTSILLIWQTMTFTWLVFSHFVWIAAIRFEGNFNNFVNKYLNWSILIPVAFQLVIIYTPLSKFFHVVHLTINEWLILISAIMLALGLAKIITYIIDKNMPLSEMDY